MIFQNGTRTREVIKNAGEVTDVAWWSINNLWEAFLDRLPYFLAALLVIVIFWLFARFVRWVFMATSQRTKLDARLRILFSRMISVFLVTLGVFTALTIVIPSLDFTNVLAGLGFTSVVVGFAAKDILNNFLSGIFILWQRPFQIGDYLFVGNNQGKVEFIGVRATSLRMDDGELILVPNGEMYSNPLTIRGAGTRRRMALSFKLGYDEQIAHAKELTLEQIKTVEGIVQEPKPSVLVTELSPDGVKINVTFWLDTNISKPLRVFDETAILLMDALQAENIELFPPGSVVTQPQPEKG